jgi:hypothetical protein
MPPIDNAASSFSHTPSIIETAHRKVNWPALGLPIISNIYFRIFTENMGGHDNPSTCLSSNKHDEHVRDIFLHYSGCLKRVGRDHYFKGLDEHEQNRIKREKERIRKLRALFDHEEKETKGMAKTFKTSLENWRNAKRRGRPAPAGTEARTNGELNGGANAESEFVKPDKDNGFDFYANMILFRNSLPFTEEGNGSLDKFPNQKVSIEKLLYEKDAAKNPLVRKCEDNEVRYFHIPGNNMEWVEVSPLYPSHFAVY